MHWQCEPEGRMRRKTANKTAKATKRRRGTAHARGHRRARATRKRWSHRVTQESDALDLEGGVFKRASPRAIALSLKRSAQRSRRRKADAYRSALSMLTFYINRAGRNLPATRRRTLEKAKRELKVAFGREG
jgi:Protein of unknown function (DUF3175)